MNNNLNDCQKVVNEATYRHYHQCLINKIGMESTTNLIHCQAQLGFFNYLNFRLDELITANSNPSMEEIHAILQHHSDTDEMVVQVKKQTSLEQVLNLVENEIHRLEAESMELLQHDDENLKLLQAMMSAKLKNLVASWKESIKR